MVHQSILVTEERIAALEAKDMLTDSHRQSVICISKMLETMYTESKVYHCEILAGIESDEAATQEQAFFDKHQSKTMEFVDHLGELVAKLQPNAPPQVSVNDHLVDRQLDLLNGSMRSVRGVLEIRELIDTHILANYEEKIRSLKKELQGARREILYCLMTTEKALGKHLTSSNCYLIYKCQFHV